MPSSLSRLAVASVATLLAVATVSAQQVRSVRPSTSNTPSASARAAQAAPNPAGLRPPIPAGLTSGSGAAVAGDPVAANGSVTRGNAAGLGLGDSTPNGSGIGGTTGNNGTDANAGAGVAAAGGVAANVARGPSQSVPLGSSGQNPVEVARAFMSADTNGNGELTRAEAARLGGAIGFEEMDRDFDGVVTRAEYGDATR